MKNLKKNSYMTPAISEYHLNFQSLLSGSTAQGTGVNDRTPGGDSSEGGMESRGFWDLEFDEE